ncbi:lasso peptide isopeptide bond-forming cyclase [Rhodocaloribacter litoris]|uniref:lasso peptide isopeptide bond-forming cyclase n=1 Tax=Rhodocaloribacter litoris TaxID=2558931 RepID=UPI001423D08C|nr:lasso peptide isopeptide bond-forming cyclase [Rhodocaloribacter litoris]QXD16158.1 lasso peptide isopeptide bond-forming cyclase [Rhodocaloribacter litoris]
MSGIAGIWHLDGKPVASDELRRMTAAIAHRGPDGTGVWTEGPVGMGQLLFRTVPEAPGEAQPLISDDGQIVLVFDGRIDNRADLLRTLALPDAYREAPDEAFVLAAYRRWGAKAPEHLLGDFAFAVWDAREQRMLLARDHFGLRPLYYVHRPGEVLAFASEIKALRALGLVSESPNERKIAEFLLIPVQVTPEMTFFRDAKAVPPAHTVLVPREGVSRAEMYWALDPEREVRYNRDEDYIERFKELFDEAVRCRLRSITPVGSMLSGGLDSTSVACTAARQLQEAGKGPLHTYSAVFDSIPACNERPYIEAALRMYPEAMRPHFYAADQGSPLAHNEELTWYLERPNEGINAYLSWDLHHQAREQGVRVVLDGFDGDTTVSHGDGIFYELLWQYRWVRLWKEVRATVLNMGGKERHARRAFVKWMKEFAYGHPWMSPMLRRRRQRNQTKYGTALAFSSLGTTWAGTAWQSYFDADFLGRMAPYLAEVPESAEYPTERARHHAKLVRPIMSYGARLIEAQAAAAGIEVRMPFFDVRLVAYCLALPADLKRRDGLGRWVMRRALEGVLPAEVQWRRDKANLAPGYIRALQAEDAPRLQQFARTIKAEGFPGNYLQEEPVVALARQLVAGHLSDPRREAERIVLWRALALAQWMGLKTAFTSRPTCKKMDPRIVDTITAGSNGHAVRINPKPKPEECL